MDIYPHAKFSHDSSRGFFSRMRKVVHQKCLLGFFFYGFFQRPTAQAREQIFTQNTSNDVVPCKDVSFRVRKKFTPYFRKLPLLGPLLTGQKHYRPKNRFTMGDAPYTAYAHYIANFAIKMAHLHCFHPLLSNGSS